MWPFNSKPSAITVEIIRRDVTKLRLGEWRADDKLTVAAAKALLDPTVQTMIQVLKNDSPAQWMLPPGTSIESRAAYQASIEGYNMALNNLESMAVHSKIVHLDEPDFANEETTRNL